MELLGRKTLGRVSGGESWLRKGNRRELTGLGLENFQGMRGDIITGKKGRGYASTI